MKEKLSVVLPLHNESGNIAKLIADITHAVRVLDVAYEIIVVDDGSSDNSLEILKNIKTDLPLLRIWHHRVNYGQSTAILSGVRAATGEIIVTLDSDGQNDPDDIPKMVSLLQKNRDGNVQMVAGHRKNRRDNLWRKLTSKIANSVRSTLLRDDTPDTGCGLKVFYKDSFLSLPSFDHMHRFLPALIQRQGGNVVSVEVNHLPRLHGTSHYGTWHRLLLGIVDLCGVAWLQRRAKIPVLEEYTGEDL